MLAVGHGAANANNHLGVGIPRPRSQAASTNGTASHSSDMPSSGSGSSTMHPHARSVSESTAMELVGRETILQAQRAAVASSYVTSAPPSVSGGASTKELPPPPLKGRSPRGGPTSNLNGAHPHGAVGGGAGGGERGGLGLGLPPRKVAKRTPVACIPCHNAKTSCQGGRPCNRCRKRDCIHLCIDVPHRKKGRPRKDASAASTRAKSPSGGATSTSSGGGGGTSSQNASSKSSMSIRERIQHTRAVSQGSAAARTTSSSSSSTSSSRLGMKLPEGLLGNSAASRRHSRSVSSSAHSNHHGHHSNNHSRSSVSSPRHGGSLSSRLSQTFGGFLSSSNGSDTSSTTDSSSNGGVVSPPASKRPRRSRSSSSNTTDSFGSPHGSASSSSPPLRVVSPGRELSERFVRINLNDVAKSPESPPTSYGSNCSIASSDVDLPPNSRPPRHGGGFPLSLSLPSNSAHKSHSSSSGIGVGVVQPRPQRFTQLHKGLQSPSSATTSPPKSPLSASSSRRSSHSNSLKRPLPHALPHHPHEQFFQRHHAQHVGVHHSHSVDSKQKLRASMSHSRSTSPPVKSEVPTPNTATSSAIDALMNMKNMFQHPKKNPEFQPPSHVKSCPVPADQKTKREPALPPTQDSPDSKLSVRERVLKRSVTPQIVLNPPNQQKTQIFSAPEQHQSNQVSPSHQTPFISLSGQSSPHASVPSTSFSFSPSATTPAILFPGNVGTQSPPPGVLMSTGANGTQQLVFVSTSPTMNGQATAAATPMMGAASMTSLNPAVYAALAAAQQQQQQQPGAPTPVPITFEELQKLSTLPLEAQQQYLHKQHQLLQQQAAVAAAVEQATIAAVAQQRLAATSPDLAALFQQHSQPQQQEEGASSPLSQNRRQRCQVACIPCHRSKTACHGGRPCDRCIRRRSEHECIDVKHRKKGRPRKSDKEKDGKASVSPPRSNSSTPAPGSTSPSARMARSSSPLNVKQERFDVSGARDKSASFDDVAPMDTEDMEDEGGDGLGALIKRQPPPSVRSSSPPQQQLSALFNFSKPQSAHQRPASFPRRAALMTPPTTPKSNQLGKRRADASLESAPTSVSTSATTLGGLADAVGVISPYLSVVSPSHRQRAASDSPVHFNNEQQQPQQLPYQLSNGISPPMSQFRGVKKNLSPGPNHTSPQFVADSSHSLLPPPPLLKNGQLQLPKIQPPIEAPTSSISNQTASRLPDLPDVRPPSASSSPHAGAAPGAVSHMSQVSAGGPPSGVASPKNGEVSEFHNFISQNRYKMIIVCTICHHANAVDKSQVTMNSAIKCIKCENLLLNLDDGGSGSGTAPHHGQPATAASPMVAPPRPHLAQVRPPSLTNVMPPPSDEMPADMCDVVPPPASAAVVAAAAAAASPPAADDDEDTHMSD